MAEGPWTGASAAWLRLQAWHERWAGGRAPLGGGDPHVAELALEALDDIGQVRRLLDQAELAAVREVRRHGRSWSEIATRLGVTRQSAWERWRDLDEPESAPRVRVGRRRRDRGPEEEADEIRARAAADALEARSRQRRRAHTVTVPDVVGLDFDGARTLLLSRGLHPVGPDPDGPPLTALGWPDGVVRDQSPEAGAKIPDGSAVTLWVDSGGGSGVREPRRPRPAPRTGRAMRDEVTDEAVG